MRDILMRFFCTKSEAELIKSTASKLGKQYAVFIRENIIDVCMNRMVRLENISKLPQFAQLSNTNADLIGKINELQEVVKNVNNFYEINRDQNLDAIAKLSIPVDSSLSEQIKEILEKNPLFLDQIREKIKNVSPKLILKALADLRKAGIVDQDIKMRWFRL